MPEQRLGNTRLVYEDRDTKLVKWVQDREEIFKTAMTDKYLKHEDSFIRTLAQIAIYHYGD